MSQITTMNWSFERDVAFFAGHGVTAVGVSVRKLEVCGVRRAAGLLRDAGLTASCLTSSGFFPLEDRRAAADALARTRDHLAAAAEIGAGCLFVLPGHGPGLAWEEAAARSRPLLEALLGDAQRLGVRLAVEPVSQLRVDLGFLHSFADALDFVDAMPSPWLGVVLELNNAWNEHDAEPGGTSAVDEVEGDREGEQEPKIHAQLAHRLDRQPHAETPCVVEQRFQERPRAGGRLFPGEARSVPGQDEQAAGADLRRSGQVIPGPCQGISRRTAILERKETRGGEAGCSEAGIPEEPRSFAHPAGLQLPD